MGLLDDAIREHLELKRRHGASDEEINQNEAEALGPARRALPAEPDADGEPAGDAEPAEEVDAAAEAVDAPPEPVAEVPVEPPPVEPPPIEPPPVESPPVEPPPVETEEDLEEPEPEPEPEPESGDEDEDVLEETPEFLQDAPEHDRLWFEQKPPRDFDFD
jgi:hypothetical protein